MSTGFQIHGHRGYRGKYPENTISGFVRAMEAGATGVEMDIVVTRENKCLVSHEPWMSADYCLKPDGQEILSEEEQELNIFEMRYDDIALFDCGSKVLEEFPDQKNSQYHKPLMFDVLKVIVPKAEDDFTFNFELKSERPWYGDFIPEPSIFIELFFKEVNRFHIWENSMVQSFDPTILNMFSKKYAEVTDLALLVENEMSFEKNVARLTFEAQYYNPDHNLVTPELVKKVHDADMKIIPWTVNDVSRGEELKEMGVDGLITDYPDLFLGN